MSLSKKPLSASSSYSFLFVPNKILTTSILHKKIFPRGMSGEKKILEKIWLEVDKKKPFSMLLSMN